MAMNLKAQDLLVVLKLLVQAPGEWRSAALAEALGMGQGEVHSA